MSRGQGAGEGGEGTKGEARWGTHRVCTSTSLNRKADMGLLAALFASSRSTPERWTGVCWGLGSSGFPQSKVVSVYKCQGGDRMCSGSYRLGHTLLCRLPKSTPCTSHLCSPWWLKTCPKFCNALPINVGSTVGSLSDLFLRDRICRK